MLLPLLPLNSMECGKNYSDALQWFDQSLVIKRKLGYKVGISDTLQNMAIIEKKEGHDEKAYLLSLECLDINRKIGRKGAMSVTLNNLAMIAKKLGKYDESENFYKQAIEIGEQLGNIVKVGLRKFNLALLYEKQNRLEESLVLLEQSVEIAQQKQPAKLTARQEVLNRVRTKLIQH